MDFVAFFIGMLIPIIAGVVTYFMYIRPRLSDKSLCYGDDRQLYKCSNSDISICAKKGVDVTQFCGKQLLKQMAADNICNTDQQLECIQADSSDEGCESDPTCCRCGGPSGADCVPKNCASNLCDNGVCDSDN